MTGSFLHDPPVSPRVQALYDEDLADDGYIWSLSRLWAHQPDTLKRLFELMSQAFTPSGLSFRQRGILVTAAASALGDSYCSLAWGGKLGTASDAATAAGVLNGSDAGLTDQEKAMAAWARKVATAPNATTPADIQALRDAGLDDGRSSPSPASWPSAWRSPRSTTPSAPSPTRNSPGPCPRRCARP
jgi:uncharacterized peroxidase-related enzyme